jgi:hypothetical protein
VYGSILFEQDGRLFPQEGKEIVLNSKNHLSNRKRRRKNLEPSLVDIVSGSLGKSFLINDALESLGHLSLSQLDALSNSIFFKRKILL